MFIYLDQKLKDLQFSENRPATAHQKHSDKLNVKSLDTHVGKTPLGLNYKTTRKVTIL